MITFVNKHTARKLGVFVPAGATHFDSSTCCFLKVKTMPNGLTYVFEYDNLLKDWYRNQEYEKQMLGENRLRQIKLEERVDMSQSLGTRFKDNHPRFNFFRLAGGGA